jgi:short-chain fatty acids transporter
MRLSDRYAQLFRLFLPSPFTIAVLLSALTFLLALVFTIPSDQTAFTYSLELLTFWEEGIWNSALMVFAMQMMLMLVLGHALALTPLADNLIHGLLRYCTSTAPAVFIVCFLTMLVAYLNWGLGLIFGAIFARKVGEFAHNAQLPINYAMVGAAGYAGLMVWHGGLSGSSLAKVAEVNHLKRTMDGLLTAEQLDQLPAQIPMTETVFSTMNLVVFILLLLCAPLGLYILAKKSSSRNNAIASSVTPYRLSEKTTLGNKWTGAEWLDHSKSVAYGFGLLILGLAVYKSFTSPSSFSLGFITPNFINFVLFGSAIVLHGSFTRFVQATHLAIRGASGILIQFPLYFGIMGMMKSAGLAEAFSAFFVNISTPLTFPVYTFFSAGLVNIFVPSGGGQWAIQGPILIKAALALDVPLAKSILALAYGDQVTNMLQPFWALPLLGITGLKAKEILPYTLFLMLIGSVIFLTALFLF